VGDAPVSELQSVTHAQPMLSIDNTYSIGGMSFAFVDRSGAAIASVPADFSSDFQTFFKGQTGSSFLMRASFPVTGDVSQVGGVTVMLNNSAGVVTTPSLKFP
jgi:hypothetical protein